MGPVPLILAAASLAGAIFGSHRKQIDPAWLEQNFGAHAVSDEALKLFNSILNSPYGQQIMSNAAEQGQKFARDTNRQAAMAGFGPSGGADSGSSIFATSAAQGASDSFQRDASSEFYKMVLPIAQQMVQGQMDAVLNGMQQGGYQTPSSMMWQNIGNAAGTVGQLYQSTQQKKTAPSPQPQPTFPQPGPSTNPDDFSPKMSYRLPSQEPILSRLGRFQSSFGTIQPRGMTAYA